MTRDHIEEHNDLAGFSVENPAFFSLNGLSFQPDI